MKFTYPIMTAALLAGGACATTSGAQQLKTNQQIVVSTDAPVLNTINIIDKTLQRTDVLKNGDVSRSGKLAVEGAGQKVTPTRTREVWATLRNLTDYPQSIEARVTWFDAHKTPVDGPSSWTRIHLPQNGAETFRQKSIDINSDAFFVEIRELY